MRLVFAITLLTVGLSSLPLVAQQSPPLTNADVIKMVKAGVPESAIVDSIQSSSAKFDVSPDALLNLHQAGVGQKVLDTMLAKARTKVVRINERSRKHKSNPKRDASEPMDARQVAEMRSKLETQFAAFRGKLPSVHEVKAQAEVKKAPEIEALERQKVFVASLRVASPKPSTALLSGGSSSTMSASGRPLLGGATPATISPGTVQPAPAPKVAATRTTLVAPPSPPSERQAPTALAAYPTTSSAGVVATQAVLATTATPQPQSPPSGGQHPATSTFNLAAPQPVLTTAPQEPSERQAPTAAAQYQPISSPNSKFAQLPVNATICTTAQVYSVNNATTGVVFTQDPAYNDFIISGRCFGIQGGEVYLSGAITGGRINMVVSEWGPNQIRAKVQPGLTGVLDGWPDLIVVPVGNPPIKFPNNRFYAQRQSVLLSNIPVNYAHLANVAIPKDTTNFGTGYCPGPDQMHLFPCISFNAGPPIDGITNEPSLRGTASQNVSNAVDRDGGRNSFDAGEDVYQLTSLAPGFVVDYFGVFWYAWSESICKGWQAEGSEKPGDSIDYETIGTYGWYQKSSSELVVDWGVDHCKWRWLGIFNVDDEYNSGYSLQVYVKGPIGVDPWTGHATTSN